MPGDVADLVFTGGVVHTVDAKNAIAQALAVSDGRVLALGSDSDVLLTAGPSTERVELGGRALLPGMIEGHGHFSGLGATQRQIDCKAPGMGSIAALVEAVRERAESQPPGTWIYGRGYDQSRLVEKRHPSRADFDTVAPNNPVLFTRTCGHIVAFNSRAMSEVGITDNVSDPEGGKYDRDASGNLTGVAYERANIPFRTIATPPAEDLREHLREANRLYLSAGCTSVQDAGGLFGAYMEQAQEMVTSGELNVRLYAFVTVNALDHPHVQILDSGLHTGFGDERLRIGAFKIMTDGSSSGPSSYTREPYTSDPSSHGIAYWEQEDLDNLLGRAHSAGWQCTVHAVGDGAIEQTLDAMKRAQSQFPRKGLRHRIEHCGILPPDLQERVVEQGIVPSMQPAFLWEFGDGYIANYGRHRANFMFPAGTLINRGVIVAGGSDAPVTDHRPLLGISQAMTRTTQDGDVCGADHAVSLDTAIRMHSINGAYASFEDYIKGSLEIGKLADMALLDQDLRDVKPHEVRNVVVDRTYVNGELVYNGKKP
ncbi:MAG: amidohydrolase [Dehalococcoidia bacterium]